MPTVIREVDYRVAAEDYGGWCTRCLEFTTTMVEPDAEYRVCEHCEQPTVFGAEQALIMGLFEFQEEGD